MNRHLPKSKRARWDSLIETEGRALGLDGCRPFLENKLVNDIFYKGLFAAMESDRAWWDDAMFMDFLFPFLRDSIRSRIGRLRFDMPFTPAVRFRLAIFALTLRLQRLFTRNGSRRRCALDRRLERFERFK